MRVKDLLRTGRLPSGSTVRCVPMKREAWCPQRLRRVGRPVWVPFVCFRPICDWFDVGWLKRLKQVDFTFYDHEVEGAVRIKKHGDHGDHGDHGNIMVGNEMKSYGTYPDARDFLRVEAPWNAQGEMWVAVEIVQYPVGGPA